LQQDNAPAQNALSVKQFLANKNITVLSTHPTGQTSLLATSTSSPKIKSVLKGTHFVSVEHAKIKTVEILNSITEHDLLNCFEHWQHRM
jgi:hypothetical protein